jgi:hypothetical protein
MDKCAARLSRSGGLFVEVDMAFETQELGVVAALAVRGIALQCIVRKNGRATFEFGPEAEEVARAHYEGRLQVQSLAFSEALRTAKGQALNALPGEVGGIR